MKLPEILILSSTAFTLGCACLVTLPLRRMIRIAAAKSALIKTLFTILVPIVAFAVGHTVVLFIGLFVIGEGEPPGFAARAAIFLPFLILGIALSLWYVGQLKDIEPEPSGT